MDDPMMLLLRLLHIAGGVFWVGAAVTAFAFVEPAAHDLGNDGQRYMTQLTKRRRLPQFVTAAAVVNLIAGGLLYWRVSGGFRAGWILSPMGMGFTIGAIAALVAAVVAVAYILPTLKGLEAAAHGDPPPRQPPAGVEALERRLRRASIANVLLLTVAVVTMATARYWG